MFETTIVRDIFPRRHPAVDGVVDHLELVARVLVDHTLGLLLEPGDGGVVPPLLQVALLVKLPSFVVKSVGNFMACG